MSRNQSTVEDEKKEEKELVQGKVTKAFGNLLQVKFNGNIRQGEVSMVKVNGLKLKGKSLRS